jgi:hypothetical protein
MNSQNILKFWGSKLDLQLDSSEYYDYEISKTELDYDDLVLDLDNTIVYTGLTINTTGLTGTDCTRDTISLVEYNNTVNDASYVYLGLSWTLQYSAFTATLGNSDTILQNDVYTYTLNNNTHYLINSGYNNALSNPFSLQTSGLGASSYACTEQLGGDDCCPQDLISEAKPWAYQINHGAGVDNCSYKVKRRTEKGWTIDLVLNRNNSGWSSGRTIYYLGVRGESDLRNYADNNLSFSFTNDGRIQWRAIRYSGICTTNSGYSETFYTSSGQTPVLCTSGTSKDFNITITFERDKYFNDCELENDGGWNDLITGRTLTTPISSWLTGATPTYEDIEILNKKWALERNRRIGTLKIYLNGRTIYKLKGWEEVIPSTRGNQIMIQSWAGGTQYSGGIHNMGISCFNFKRVQYYEEPLNFVRVRHHYLVDTKPNYNIIECVENCVDSMIGL